VSAGWLGWKARSGAGPAVRTPPRRPLFRKYFVALFVAVVVPLLANGASDAWFSYIEQRALLDERLHLEARSAAGRIQSFLDGIRDQLGWAVQLPWGEGEEERHRVDALRVLRQVPAIVNLTLIDGEGNERLYVSRIGLNRIGSGMKRAADPAVTGAKAAKVWYGPVSFYRGSEPFMTMAIAGNRSAAGVVVADINLKLIWDVISAIQVGVTGKAFVLDRQARLIAHPDISLVLRGAEESSAASLRQLKAEFTASPAQAVIAQDAEHRSVLAATEPIPGAGWTVVAEQPLDEAFAPIRATLWRTAGLLVAGGGFAALLAFWLARHMATPIRLLEEGVERVGSGQFDHRIELSTGDELEQLATRVNQMAGELAISQERHERIGRLKRFLPPQVAELVDRSGPVSLLDPQRAEVIVVFCDLRGFTAFSAGVAAEEIMRVLSEFYGALGTIVTRYEATLTSFLGDGLMVLVNAPLPCPEPAHHALKMAAEMQDAVQALILEWRARGYQIGFGVGLAMGPATVGQVGYEGRVEYTAIGSVVNLASRLCASAEDSQILLDAAVASAVSGRANLASLGWRQLKGYDKGVPVYTLARGAALDISKSRALQAGISR
jgi:class 3 adenylate cyclase